MMPPINAFLPPARHANPAEYRAFLARHSASAEMCDYYEARRMRFIQAYPDMTTWMTATLEERVGKHRGMSSNHATHRASYGGRQYLFYLAMRHDMACDWDWLISLSRIHLDSPLTESGFHHDLDQLQQEALQLGYHPVTASRYLHWTASRIFLHSGFLPIARWTEIQCQEMMEAVHRYSSHPELPFFFASRAHYEETARKSFLTALHLLGAVLYHRGQSRVEPRKRHPPLQPSRPIRNPLMWATCVRYLDKRRLTDRPGTIAKIDLSLRKFIAWIAGAHPEIATFRHVTRDHICEFAVYLKTAPAERSGIPLALLSQRGNLAVLSVFFQDVACWEWEDGPGRPLFGPGDLPKIPERIPRFIPEDELVRLMDAIRTLSCLYQRGALLIARWSGARRDEIRRLQVDCLDQYPDGTPRLHLPAGKTKRERLVPVHDEAAEAIRQLQALYRGQRGLRDELTGTETTCLFMNHGKCFSNTYLFDTALKYACEQAGLVDEEGHPLITAHRFRHTVGTQLAERGAKLHTIMTILGHSSVNMSLVYAQISDREVLREYQAVLGPGAIMAGPQAEKIRSGALSQSAVDWLQANFFKTELELGRCLRLPQEGPCECDLYLTCAKFVTTPEYAPRLRQRWQTEQQLIEDAQQRGWDREVERHTCTAQRIEMLLQELGEPLDGD